MSHDLPDKHAENAESAYQSGLEFLRYGDLTAASRAFRAAIEMDPSSAQAHLGLGNCLRLQRQPSAAELALRQAQQLDPALHDAAFSLAFLLHRAGRDTEAAGALTELADKESADLTLQRQVAGLLMDFGLFQEALRLARKIAEAAPAPGAWQRLGICLLQLKRLAEAEEAFNLAVRHDPLAGAAYLFMSQTRRATEGDRSRLRELQAILEKGEIAGEERACMHFALGNWLEDLGDYSAAWEQFSAAHRLRRRERPFNRSTWADYFRRLLKTKVHMGRPDEGPAPQPLFLVGLPGARSEPLASLVASHPAVYSLGISEQVDSLARACEQLADQTYPACLDKIEASQLGGLGQGFRNDWPDKSQNSTWILDESPLNFLHLALIVQVFPGSRIIYQHRSSLDDCLSAYLFPFSQPMHSYVHDLEDLAFFYRQFNTLMTHWQASLPAQTLLPVSTDRLQAGADADTAAIWKFLDLDTAPSAGVPHLSSRAILAADPMGRDIPGRWGNYREHLAPLLKATSVES